MTIVSSAFCLRSYAMCCCNKPLFTSASTKPNVLWWNWLTYLVAECLARQAKLSSAYCNRDLAHLLSSTGFGPAHNPAGQIFRMVVFKNPHWHCKQGIGFTGSSYTSETVTFHFHYLYGKLCSGSIFHFTVHSWCVPGGDLIEAGDDCAGHPSYWHRVKDVFSLLAEVGARDGHHGASFQQTREWLNLRKGTTSIENKLLGCLECLR